MSLTPSIVMPVFDRTDELRRALSSLAAQTLADFECLVVDDCSTVDVAAVVDEFDDRFRYLRTEVNGGPSRARLVAFEQVAGDVVVLLDSDNELFPWALDRVVRLLGEDGSVSGVSGLYVYPDGLRVRVGGGRRVLTPEDYARTGSSLHDMVGAVRTDVVAEWLGKRRDYYAAEFSQWLTYHLGHRHLLVDEPWGRYNEGTGPRVSRSPDERNHLDVGVFVAEHRQLLDDAPCAPLDGYLRAQWLTLRRAGRPEAALVEEWMRRRGLSRRSALALGVAARLPSRRGAAVVL